MWSNGDDFNEEGERVRLYQPIAYSSGRSFSPSDPTASYIGGGHLLTSSVLSQAAFCANCHEPLDRLVQLHVPQTTTTYQVLGCNRAKCVNALFAQHNNNHHQKFNLGGGGVIQCHRVDTPEPETTTEVTVPKTVDKQNELTAAHIEETNDWLMDSDDDGDFGDDNSNGDLKDLEEQVAALEMKEPTLTKSKISSKTSNQKKSNSKKSSSNNQNNGLPCFELHSLLEPPGKHRSSTNHGEDDDDDDSIIGGIGNSKDDAKIQQMLAKYMAEEDDADILTALQGTMGGGGGGGNTNNKSREKDERLKAADRALYAFTDRIKRSPRQVLRYASGGVPLWSIPRAPQPPTNREKKSKISFQDRKHTEKASSNDPQPLVIPKCSCGSERRFEFQLMPSLLHVLEVDKHAVQASGSSSGSDNVTSSGSLDAIMNQDYGGMNWGAIAVYVCPNATHEKCSKDEFVIVQASVDETPHKRAVAPADAAVIIREDQTFDALCDDGDLDGGVYDDETDDESQVDEKDLVFTLDG